MKIRDMKDRFMLEDPGSRLGHLASNLLRISELEPTAGNWPTVQRSVRESMYFIEWTVPDAPEKYRSALAGLQGKLAEISHIEHSKWRLPESERMRATLKEWSDLLVKALTDMRAGQPLSDIPASIAV
jgi:hypothetical protein